MYIGNAEALKARMEKCIVSDCKDCPYTDAQICDTAMTKDALEYIESLEERIAIKDEALEALEKRNEPIRPDMILTTSAGCPMSYCPNCNEPINQYRHPKFCGACGQAVKWE